MQLHEEPKVTVGLPAGATRTAHVYWDGQNRRRQSRIPVPVNDFGQIAATGWRCPKCTEPRWVPIRRVKDSAVAEVRVPVCPVHDRKMLPLRLSRPPIVPVRELWAASERQLRPVWALPAVAAAGAAVDVGQVPAVAVAVAVPAGFEAARRAYRRYATSVAVQRGRLDGDDPQAHKRRRAAIDRAARKVGYTAAAGAGWLTTAATVGLDPSTWPGRLVWSALLPVWALPAASWWWHDRHREIPRVTAEEAPADDGPGADPVEAEVMRRWHAKIAVRKGDVIGQDSAGKPVRAERDGRLPGAKLTGWRPIKGGWQATIRGPVGEFESDQFLQARGKIAGAFSVGKSMVTVLPDPDDENVAMLMVQRAAVVAEEVRWTGPDSINVSTGRAPLVQYVDGAIGEYELWRPGWGVAHEFYCGTTGSGKSEALNTVLAVDRWANHLGRGLVADFLVDSQHGQSFGAFADDLTAPIASTFEEAMLLVQALDREARRRNRYLSRIEWVDEKGRPRKGRKAWDPLIDGPILCLNIDEAHEFLADRKFVRAITAGARMWRKCGMKIRIATHTPLLTDLGGSMALRDMLTGGFVWMGRTANSLSGPTAFNGRLPADPRSIPEIPGACFVLSAHEKRSMLARTMWEPDYYDWVRDDQDRPVGFPAVLPAETLDAFGSEYGRWVEAASAGRDWQPVHPTGGSPTPSGPARRADVPEPLVDAVLSVLACAPAPVDMTELDADLRGQGVDATTLQVRAALRELREQGLVFTGPDRRHELTPQAREDVDAQVAETGGAFDGGAA